jgi:hypothetical protein
MVMPNEIWRPSSGPDGVEGPGAVSSWRRRAVLGLVAVAFVAVGSAMWIAPSAVRNWHEHRYCRSEYNATLANHKRLVAEGQPDFYFNEHFVAHHDFMDRCLATEKCQRHGLFGLEHGPRKKCWATS